MAFPYPQSQKQALYCKWHTVTEPKHSDDYIQVAVKLCNLMLENAQWGIRDGLHTS